MGQFIIVVLGVASVLSPVIVLRLAILVLGFQVLQCTQDSLQSCHCLLVTKVSALVLSPVIDLRLAILVPGFQVVRSCDPLQLLDGPRTCPADLSCELQGNPPGQSSLGMPC